MFDGLARALGQHLGARQRDILGVLHLAHGQRLGQIGIQLVEQAQLVARGQLDVDAFDVIGVLAHPIQRNHHVLVDFEGVGVAGDGGRARTVQPEFLARLGADRHEALAVARIGQAHHFAGGGGHGILVVADDVADQHHLGQHATLALGGIAHRAQVALVQVLQAGQDGAARLALAVQVALDLDDGRDGVARLPEEFHADRAGVARHAVQHPARRRDQAVTAFLLHARQAGQEFVGHVLAQAGLAELAPLDIQALGAQQLLAGLAGAVEPFQFEAGHVDVVDLAQVVRQPGHFQPVAVRIHHAPPGQVVQRGAPQHGLLAACVHGDVAAHAGCLGRSRIDSEHEAGALGGLGHPLGDHAGAGADHGGRLGHARQHTGLDLAQGLEFLGIDDGRLPGQRNRAARVARTAAARHNGQAQLDTGAHQRGDLVLGVGREHHERVFDPPVGGVGNVRYARQAVELDVVARGDATQHPLRLPAQLRGLVELALERGHRRAGARQQLDHLGVAARIMAGLGHGGRLAALVDLAQAVVQRLDQQLAALGVVEQVVLQVGIAPYHPDIAQHLVQHARRTAGAALAAQVADQLPGVFAQQAADDLTVGERRVVVRDFAQTRAGCGRYRRGQDLAGEGGVHGSNKRGP
ncbi:Uncharacterised protein [Bordetella pertussis]|nr:Uncharacterised protein [Bordetella pertussis]CRE30381.1 Uncharacterised protein [Bordetella pertussis]